MLYSLPKNKFSFCLSSMKERERVPCLNENLGQDRVWDEMVRSRYNSLIRWLQTPIIDWKQHSILERTLFTVLALKNFVNRAEFFSSPIKFRHKRMSSNFWFEKKTSTKPFGCQFLHNVFINNSLCISTLTFELHYLQFWTVFTVAIY